MSTLADLTCWPKGAHCQGTSELTGLEEKFVKDRSMHNWTPGKYEKAGKELASVISETLEWHFGLSTRRLIIT